MSDAWQKPQLYLAAWKQNDPDRYRLVYLILNGRRDLPTVRQAVEAAHCERDVESEIAYRESVGRTRRLAA